MICPPMPRSDQPPQAHTDQAGGLPCLVLANSHVDFYKHLVIKGLIMQGEYVEHAEIGSGNGSEIP